MKRRLPMIEDRDRFAAAALAVDRLLRYLRRRQPQWAHYADSAAGVTSDLPPWARATSKPAPPRARF